VEGKFAGKAAAGTAEKHHIIKWLGLQLRFLVPHLHEGGARGPVDPAILLRKFKNFRTRVSAPSPGRRRLVCRFGGCLG
jgi:hypothetical protein